MTHHATHHRHAWAPARACALPCSLPRALPRALLVLAAALPLVAAAPALAQPGAPAAASAAADPATACWREVPPDWAGVLLVGSLRDGRFAVRADGSGSAGPLQPQTRLNIASLGKMFTAVAIGQLVDAGLLRLEDPAARHLPVHALPEAFQALTLAQMLSHTAGLGSYLEEHALAQVEAAATAQALLPLATARLPEGVGTWRYSNSGYAIAAAVVEAVSGLDYETYVRQRIFDPAGMRSIGFAPGPGDALPTVIGAQGQREPSAIGRMRGGPAGGAFATVEDLFHFSRALHDGRLLSATTLERITSLQHEIGPRRADGVARGWGFGFGVTGHGRERLYGHTGGVPGAAAAFRVRVADGRMMVALAPQDQVPAGAWSGRLLDMPVASCAAPAGAQP